MKSVRWFALGVLSIASLTWPAAGYANPAISLQHLLADKDCESASELLGDWQAGSDLSGIWTVQTFGDRKYRLIQKVGESDRSNKEAFDICVAHLGGYLFFDATFQTIGPDGKTVLGDDDNFFWIPLHLIGRLDVVGDALHFRLLDDGWLQDELKSGRLQLTCSQDDEGQFLLTAPSKELKQFAARFAADPRAFSYVEEFAWAPGDETQDTGPTNKPYSKPLVLALREGINMRSLKGSNTNTIVQERRVRIPRRYDAEVNGSGA